MNDFQCLLCGATFDGVLHTKPEKCPECGGPESEIVDAEEQHETDMKNWIINKQEDMRHDD